MKHRLWVWGLLILLFLPGCRRDFPGSAAGNPEAVPAENLIQPKITPTPFDFPTQNWGSARMIYDPKTGDYRFRAEIEGHQIDKYFRPATKFTAALEPVISRDENTGLFLYRYRLSNFPPGPASITYLELTSDAKVTRADPELIYDNASRLAWDLEMSYRDIQPTKERKTCRWSRQYGLEPGKREIFSFVSPEPPGILPVRLEGSGKIYPALGNYTFKPSLRDEIISCFVPRSKLGKYLSDNAVAYYNGKPLIPDFEIPVGVECSIREFYHSENFDYLMLWAPGPEPVSPQSRYEFLLRIQALNRKALDLSWVSFPAYQKIETYLQRYRFYLQQEEGQEEIVSALNAVETMKARNLIRNDYYYLIKGNLQFLSSLETAGMKAGGDRADLRRICRQRLERLARALEKSREGHGYRHPYPETLQELNPEDSNCPLDSIPYAYQFSLSPPAFTVSCQGAHRNDGLQVENPKENKTENAEQRSPEEICRDNLRSLCRSIEKFLQDHGHLPATLEQLKAGYLQEIPRCPLHGLPYGYQLREEGEEGSFRVFCRENHYREP